MIGLVSCNALSNPAARVQVVHGHCCHKAVGVEQRLFVRLTPRCTAAPRMAAKRRKKGVASTGFGGPAKPAPFDLRKKMTAAMNAYVELRGIDKLQTKDISVDVYVKASGADKFWFVGKSVGCKNGEGACDATSSLLLQKRIVLEHAKKLQRELAESKQLQLWSAPSGTEVMVAQRKQALTCLDGMRAAEGLVETARVGFEPEQYDAENQKGFGVVLPDDGVPLEGTQFETRFVAPDALESLDLGGVRVLDDARSVDDVADGRL